MSTEPRAAGTIVGDEQPVIVEVVDSIAVITLNRPERLNAWTNALDVAYLHALLDADRNPRVRVLVVTGAGRAFSAGADIQVLKGMVNGGPGVSERVGPEALAELSLTKPVIAAINGACAGLALVHALSCDIRFVSEEAKLSTAFVRRGLVAEHGVSWLLTRVAGAAVALDLLLSGRTFTGREAAAMGLATRAVPATEVLQVAMAYARDLAANCSPRAMREIKGQIWGDLHSTFAQSVLSADALMVESLARPDFRVGVESFLERRPPSFEEPPSV
jgi:enoyl-CoA hydratase/carnithine racemase